MAEDLEEGNRNGGSTHEAVRALYLARAGVTERKGRGWGQKSDWVWGTCPWSEHHFDARRLREKLPCEQRVDWFTALQRTYLGPTCLLRRQTRLVLGT